MTPTTIQIIAGQNVKANSKPAPTGFGFGSGHNPTAAAKMMVRSGAAPMTSKTSPTLTHIDLRYSRMDKCGLTVKLSGRATVPDQRRGRTPFSSAGGAQPQAHHGPPPMIVRTQQHRNERNQSEANHVWHVAPVRLTVKLSGRPPRPD